MKSGKVSHYQNTFLGVSPLSLIIAFTLVGCQAQTPEPLIIPSPTFTPLQTPSQLPAVQDSQFLFVSRRDGKSEIYLEHLGGTGPVNLTNHPSDDMNPVWSPDGQFIAFRSIRDGQEQVYLMRSDGTQVTPIPKTGPLDVPVDWSPDGQYLVLISRRDVNAEIYAVKPDGTSMVNLSRHPADDGYAAWSPDGSRIAFVSDRMRRSDKIVTQIFVMDIHGTAIVQLTDFPKGADRPVWSPDSSHITFAAINERGGSDVYVMEADGANARQLTHQSGWYFPQSWSADGNQILVSRSLYGAADNFLIPFEDGTSTPLPMQADYVRRRPAGDLIPSIVLPAPEEELPSQTLALVNGTLIEGTGADPVPDARILIQDGRIVAAGPSSEVNIPSDYQIMDVREGVMLPGFVDAHVHGATIPQNLAAWAQAGVTTVCSLAQHVGGLYRDWNDWVGQAHENHTPPFLFAFRDATLNQPQYARLVAAGPIVSVADGYPRDTWGPGIDLAVSSPQDAREKVAALLDAGADIVKISLESGPRLSEEEVRAIVDVAHEKGTVVTAHVATTPYLSEGIAGGIDSAAHMSTDRWSDELLVQMVLADVYLVPTLSVYGRACGQPGDCLDNLHRFVEAGGHVALGNDFGNPGAELGMPMREMELMQLAGMTPMQIIVSATQNAAHACNQSTDLGTLEAGKIADVLVVDGDPLQDLHALANVRLVVHNGVIIRPVQSSP